MNNQGICANCLDEEIDVDDLCLECYSFIGNTLRSMSEGGLI
jgi:hypothetical protein